MVTEGPATRTPAVPGPPTAVAGVNGSPVTWTAPVVTGEYVVTSYKVYLGDVLQETVAAPSTTSVGAFSSGTVVRVSAVNAIGEGAKSSPATSPATHPGAPTITLVDENVGVVWTAPGSDGGTPIIEYYIYQDGVVQDAVPVGGLVWAYAPNPGSAYEVSAANAVGEGPRSAPVTAPVA